MWLPTDCEFVERYIINTNHNSMIGLVGPTHIKLILIYKQPLGPFWLIELLEYIINLLTNIYSALTVNLISYSTSYNTKRKSCKITLTATQIFLNKLD